MKETSILKIQDNWYNEISSNLLDSETLLIGLFSVEKELLFANKAMSSFFFSEPENTFINPTFDTIRELDSSNTKIFEGYITIGNFSSVNASVWAQIYRKNNEILVLGGINASQLIDYNKTMHQLNREISNLQRDLIKEKSNLKNALNDLSIANKELKEINNSKDRFISILAHDLKSPFNSILGFLSLLTSNIKTYSIDTIEKQINLVNNSAQNTFHLLEEILNWARAQSGKTPFNPSNCNLYNVCVNSIQTLKLPAKNKEINIELKNLEGIEVNADKNMLNTIIRNLVSNAIKFSNIGGVVCVSAKRKESIIQIKVTDNGIGMDKSTVSKLFDIAHKVSKLGTENEKGTGLGLLLCKEFVEKHNGKIWVKSELDKGSEFIFTILND